MPACTAGVGRRTRHFETALSQRAGGLLPYRDPRCDVQAGTVEYVPEMRCLVPHHTARKAIF